MVAAKGGRLPFKIHRHAAVCSSTPWLSWLDAPQLWAGRQLCGFSGRQWTFGSGVTDRFPHRTSGSLGEGMVPVDPHPFVQSTIPPGDRFE